MSQAELGEVTGVTRSSVNQWEKGKTVPELERLQKMSEFFGVSLETIVGDETAEQSVDAELLFLKKEIADALRASFLSTIASLKKPNH
jgi:transcriptional regulator with XRE-family HTH domain